MDTIMTDAQVDAELLRVAVCLRPQIEQAIKAYRKSPKGHLSMLVLAFHETDTCWYPYLPIGTNTNGEIGAVVIVRSRREFIESLADSPDAMPAGIAEEVARSTSYAELVVYGYGKAANIGLGHVFPEGLRGIPGGKK